MGSVDLLQKRGNENFPRNADVGDSFLSWLNHPEMMAETALASF